MSVSLYVQRADTLIKQCLESGIDAAIVTSMPNMRYLSGFTGDSGMLIITKDQRILISDFRYTEQAAKQAPDYTYQEFSRGKEYDLCAEICTRAGVSTGGFEAEDLNVSTFSIIQEKNPISWKAIDDILSKMRSVKSEDELNVMRKAGKMTDQTFEHMLTYIKPGLTEIEIALELEFYIRSLGASAVSFNTIIASGENGSLPHAIPSGRKVQNGDMITMDFGCVVDGYCSDMTRTVALGELAQSAVDVYNICLDAQLNTCAAIKPGMSCSQADAIARGIIEKTGYGDSFGHGLGHGVGIQVHEAPTLSPSSNTILEPGMIITIEPGIYLPGKFGVRIEDFGLVTEDGFESFVVCNKELINL